MVTSFKWQRWESCKTKLNQWVMCIACLGSFRKSLSWPNRVSLSISYRYRYLPVYYIPRSPCLCTILLSQLGLHNHVLSLVVFVGTIFITFVLSVERSNDRRDFKFISIYMWHPFLNFFLITGYINHNKDETLKSMSIYSRLIYIH